jgi:hypothetical protein
VSENETPEKENGLVFDEAPSVIPVTIKGPDGKMKNLELREMDGELLTKWFEILGGRVKTNRAGRQVGKIDFTKFHASLISLCLYDTDTNQRVSKEVIDKWKASTQNALFNKCREMNGLTDEAAEDAKND